MSIAAVAEEVRDHIPEIARLLAPEVAAYPGESVLEVLRVCVERNREHRASVERRLAEAPGEGLLCHACLGVHAFDTSIASPLWNVVVRGAGLPDYLCLLCVVRVFAGARRAFSALLYGPGVSGGEVVFYPEARVAVRYCAPCHDSGFVEVQGGYEMRACPDCNGATVNATEPCTNGAPEATNSATQETPMTDP